MIVDDVYIFLLKGAENFDEDKIRSCIDIAKGKVPNTKIKELHLKYERGFIEADVFAGLKKFRIEL